MRRLAKLFLMVMVFCSLVYFTTQPTYAQTTQAWTGVCTNNSKADGVATIQGLQCLVGNLLQIAVSGIGLAGFIILLVGSFRYMLSGGNSKDVDESRKMIVAAVVGLILALSAFFILRILADFTGVKTILEFTIPSPSSKVN